MACYHGKARRAAPPCRGKVRVPAPLSTLSGPNSREANDTLHNVLATFSGGLLWSAKIVTLDRHLLSPRP